MFQYLNEKDKIIEAINQVYRWKFDQVPDANISLHKQNQPTRNVTVFLTRNSFLLGKFERIKNTKGANKPIHKGETNYNYSQSIIRYKFGVLNMSFCELKT